MAELTLHQKLIDIQQRLKVPKDKRNEYSTSKFMYRNLEAIEEAVKPMLKEHGLVLTFSDEVLAVGDRVFVKATASLGDSEKKIEAVAFAQHATDKKGMDDAQLTGSCSSYARKYAAGGLFLIDETKDADSMDNSHSAKEVRDRKAEAAAGAQPITNDVLSRAKKAINEALEAEGYDTSVSKQLFVKGVLNKETIDDLNDADLVMDAIENNQ